MSPRELLKWGLSPAAAEVNLGQAVAIRRAARRGDFAEAGRLAQELHKGSPELNLRAAGESPRASILSEPVVDLAAGLLGGQLVDRIPVAKNAVRRKRWW